MRHHDTPATAPAPDHRDSGRNCRPAFGPASLAQQGSPSNTRPPGTNYKAPAWTFNKIADGVYHAVGTGSLVVMSNATIIEGDQRCAGRRLASVAGRRVGAARRAEGDHAEADSLGRQLALSLRSLARQPDLRPRGRDHRPRVRAPADPRRQVAGLAGARVLRRRHPQHDQDPRGPARRREGRQGEARRSRTSSRFSAITSRAPTRSSQRRRR